MIFDFLGGLGVSEVKLVREIRDHLDEYLERNVFPAGREVGDAQAAVGVSLSVGHRPGTTPTERHQALAEGARGQIERLQPNPSHVR